MPDVLIIDATTGERTERSYTAAERNRRDQEIADTEARRQDEEQRAARRAELADKAKAGTLTTDERDEALALLL